MKRRLLSIVLVLAMLVGAFPMTAFALEPVYVEFSWKEGFVYEGGIFDMRVHVFGTNAEKATYRWQTDPSFGKGHWSDLKDNSAWRGTKTDHLQLYTNSGILDGTGWEEIPFRCLVTVDGKEYATPDFYIQVMPKSYLISALKAHKEGFEQPGGVGMGGYNEILSKTEEGFPTHATAYAGSQLGFAINHTDPSRSFFSDFQRSEVSFIPEIKVYKNGSPVQSGEDVCLYTPTAAGDTLTVEHILYLKAGETDHGVYQSNKMTIDIIAPEPLGSAAAKYDCSLLNERYNESQKLISIPKGREVQIIENSGDTWYKVLYYNTVGWLPADALNIQKQIAPSNTFDIVEVGMMQPTAQLPAPFTAKTGDSGYTVHSIDWFDDAEERFLEQGEVLQGDRTYAVSIWLKAEDGSEFAVDNNGRPAVKGLINGGSVKVNKAYEQDPRQVIELSAGFAPMAHTCAPVLVQRVAPTCQQAGHEEYYLCECGKAYRDAAASEVIDLQREGVLPIAAHKAGDWSYNGTHHYRKCEVCTAVVPGTNAAHSGDPCKVCGFASHVCRTELIRMVDPTCERDGFEKYYKCQQCGKTYKDANATQLVDLSSWGVIPKLPHTPGEWGYNGTHHYRKCVTCMNVISGTTQPHTGAVCDVCGYVDPNARKKITSVEIDGVAEPQTGNAPDYTFSVGEGYAIDQEAKTYEYMHRGVAWYDITDGKFVSLRHAFIAGHQYQVYIELKPDKTHIFGRLWASVNGDDADFAGSDSKLTVSYIFPPCEYDIKEITSVDINGVSEPQTGNAPDYTFSVGEGYEIDQDAKTYEYMHRGVAWYDITDGEFVSLRHAFIAGHQYQVYISLKPEDGYEFGRLWASVNGDDADFAGSDSKLTVSYIFPPCESDIKEITSVEINGVAEPKTGGAPDYTFSVGEGYAIDQEAKTYEYMHRGIAWYDITDGEFVSLRHAFIAGHQYQVYISLKPEDGYEFGRLWASVNGDDADFAGSNSQLTVSYIFPPCEVRSSSGTRPYRG